MPKAIQAIRSYPATLLLALLLFVATLVVTTGSLGKVGSGGGDSGDGGSGIGGTGKSGEFGGSGFGGTGGPSPFFTSVDDEDRTAEPAVLDHAESVLTESSPAELVTAESQESTTSEIETSLSDEIADVIEQHPLVNESEAILAADLTDSDEVKDAAADSPMQSGEPAAMQVVEAVQLESSELPAVDVMPSQDVQPSAVAENTAEDEPAPTSDVLQNLAETVPVKLDTAPQSIDPEVDRRSLPERIQRPELPPFQRIRPVERAAIMPPRVQPMRI